MLREQDIWKTGKELATYLQVTDRTIRSDIESINDFYGCTLIESNVRLGYHLDSKLFLNRQSTRNEDVLPQTCEERCKWLLQELLFKKSKINLEEVKSKIFISDASLENDLKKVRKTVGKYPSLKLVKYRNQISLDGDELDKRKLYKDLLTQETHGNFINMNTIANLWKDFDLLAVRDTLTEIMEDYRYEIRDSNFPMIMIHVGVALERIINHNYISKVNIRSSLQESIEYQISKQFFQTLSEKLSIEVVEVEVDLFALLLLGKGSSQYYKYDEKYIDHLIDQIFDEIKSFFDIDLSNDYDLRVGLTSHLCSLLDRQKNDMKVTNLYLKQIKKNYPLVFEMAVHSGQVICQYTKKEVNENELAFLALHLGSAYDRLNMVHKHRALAIIPHGQILSKSCVDKLDMRFNARMEIIDTISFFEEEKVAELKPDLLLTTAPLEHDLQISTVQISLFVSYEDESKVFQALNMLDKKYYEQDFQTLFKKLMRKDLFKIVNSAKSSDDIIQDMCSDLMMCGLAQNDFRHDVMKRESISATSFVYGIAIPHAISARTKESCIVTRILKKPVRWGDFEVRLVMLLGIHEVDSTLLKILFDSISETVINANKFSKLLEANSYEEFVQTILEQGE